MSNEFSMPILKSITGLESQNVSTRPNVATTEGLIKADSAKGAPDQTGLAQQAEQQQIKPEELKSTVSEINSVVQNLHRDLLFSVDEKNGGTFVKVVDTETDEVIREIPSKDIREIKAKLDQVAGLFINEST